MTNRVLLSVSVLVAAAATAIPVSAVAQDQDVPRTAWGAPDFGGVWDFRTLTPLQRPRALGDQAVYTAEEVAAFEARRNRSIAGRDDREPADIVGNYNQFWFDGGATVVETMRTSLVVDPPDGRIPPLTPAAEKLQMARDLARAGATRHEPSPGGWVDDLGSGMFAVRCLLGFNSGPPMTPAGYNQNVQVFQTEGHVVLLNEMVHSARVVPLDRSEHIDPSIRQRMGDSRGHWDGDTLVIETTNMLRETSFLNGLSDANLQLTERLTRVSAGTLLYEVTVDDPTVWMTPWTYQLPMKQNDQQVYEYACHEGNSGLYNILAGARQREQATEDALDTVK
jgi:hypothetical protein